MSDAAAAVEPSESSSPPPARGKTETRRQKLLRERQEARTSRAAMLNQTLDEVARMAQARRPPAPTPSATDDEPVYTARDEVPGAFSNDPMQRDGMTFGPIEAAEGEQLPDTAGRGPPKNLTDICQAYPIGDGMVYIRVERKKPEFHANQRAAGFLGHIRNPMSEPQFRNYYGGGQYELTVYGPDRKKGGHKALTKPIGLPIPGNPNVFADDGEDPSEPQPPWVARGADMREGWDPVAARRRAAPPTPAEATIHGQALSFAQENIREERREARALREKLGDSGAATQPALTAISDQATITINLLRDQLNADRQAHLAEMNKRDAEIGELRRRIEDRPPPKSESSDAWNALSTMAQAIAPGKQSGDEIGRLHEQHRNEMRHVDDSHKNEMVRLTESHRGDITTVRTAHEEQLRILRAELDRANARTREDVEVARRLGEDRATQIRDEWDRRYREQGDKHKEEITRIEKTHEHEITRLKEQHTLLLETQKSQQEMKYQALKERLEIAKEDRDRARKDLEEAEDLEAQIEKTERNAERLGLVRAEEDKPKDWKERLAAAASHAIMNADKILEGVGKTVSARREVIERGAQERERQNQQGQQRQAPAGRQIGGAGAPPRRSVWATEGGANIARRAVQPTQQQQSTNVAPATVVSRRPVAQTQPSGPPTEQPEPQQAPQRRQPAPEQQPAPPPQAAEAAPPNGAGAAPAPAQRQQFDPAELEALRAWIEMEIEANRSPEDFAQAFIERVGLDNAIQNASVLKPDDIIRALAEDPNTAGSPIVRREGQKWLKDAWKALRSIIKQPRAEA